MSAQGAATPSRTAHPIRANEAAHATLGRPAVMLRVSNLRVAFRGRMGLTLAVDDLSFDLAAGETLALVGESGCGKTASALAMMGLIPRKNAHISGSAVLYPDIDLIALREAELRTVRGRRISIVFQEPMTALNPLLTIGAQVVEAIRLHRRMTGTAAKAEALDVLAVVGLPDPNRTFASYPHELSGGMRQRGLIAMAVAPGPEVLIADEPTTALDVTVQLRILELLQDLKRQLGLSILLITHDLGVVSHFADRAAIMFSGRKVEEAPVRELLETPRHPYTRRLIEAVPSVHPSRLKGSDGSEQTGGGDARRAASRQGAVLLTGNGEGCVYAAQCTRETLECRETPALAPVGHAAVVACWHAGEATA